VSLSDWVKQHEGTTVYTMVAQYNDQTIAAGIISLFVAVVFFADAVVTFFVA